jgi:hypothetical protein
MTEMDEREADSYCGRPKTKEEKLELIREMRAQLMSGERRHLDSEDCSAR